MAKIEPAKKADENAKGQFDDDTQQIGEDD